MIDMPGLDAIKAALRAPLGHELHELIASRLQDAVFCGLADLTHVLVIQRKDTEAQIIEAIGFSPLGSRMDGNRLQPDWDYIEPHPGWWELCYTVGNSGFAFLVFVERADGVLPELLSLCGAGTDS